MTDFEPEAQPLPALARLHVLVAEAASKRGLLLRQFYVVPNMNPEGPHMASIVAGLDPDFEKQPEQVADPEFEKVIRDAEKAEQEQQAEKARESLSKLRDTLSDRNKGIGLDD